MRQMLDLLEQLAHGRTLSPAESRDAFEQIMTGSISDVEIAAFLTALRVRGETVDELFGAASIMREKVVPLGASIPGLLDTCGVGGDQSGTFNISTAAAIVAAAAGVPVAKHGNRGLSSPSGSAEVLAELGVEIELPPERVLACLTDAGIGFFFAPHWHPAMKHVMPVRRQLRFRTIFNLLGPLSNPAGAEYQLLGVGRADWAEKMASALARLGATSATVVTGGDGLDEVTLDGPTTAYVVRGGQTKKLTWTSEDFGLPSSSCADWQVDSPARSAQVVAEILDGKRGPCRDIVLANAAAALWTAEKTGSVFEGVAIAAETVDSGKAKATLQKLIQVAKQGSSVE